MSAAMDFYGEGLANYRLRCGTITTKGDIKAEEVDGVRIAQFEGYIASFKAEDNEWPDQFVPGAFLASLNEHKARDMRAVRMLFMHDRDQPIGGFPIEKVMETSRGLFATGVLSLSLQKASEVYSMLKLGFLSDMSIGYQTKREWVEFMELPDGRELRRIKQSNVREGSIVDEPMNPDAMITAVKCDGNGAAVAVPKSERITKELLETMTPRDIESFLVECGAMSQNLAKRTAGWLKRVPADELAEPEFAQKAHGADTAAAIGAIRDIAGALRGAD